MGARGPAPKPTALRVLQGDRRDRINLDEPKPRNLPAVKPKWLSSLASVEWDRIAPDLGAMGIVRSIDSTTLAAYCETVARWRVLVDYVAHSSPVVVNAEGVTVKNPAVAQLRDASADLRVWAREFGLTPSSRAGLRATSAPTEAGERLLGRR